MIRCISRLRGFGVFQDFRKTNDCSDFGAKNVIYGWNYSGKTTLSRLFAAIGDGANKEFPGATFEISLVGRGSITDATISEKPLRVAVFNSDFIATNLNWVGEDFSSILLLGDAVDAQKQIDQWLTRVSECRVRFKRSKDAVAAANTRVAEARTKAAKDIKQTLKIVEAFTAAHLTTETERLGANPASAILSEQDYKSDMKLALASEQDKPKEVEPVLPPTLMLDERRGKVAEAIKYIPAISATIDRLRNHAHIARWVEQGLEIHEGATSCEFCAAPLGNERLNELKSHFSQDLSSHKNRLRALLSELESIRRPPSIE